jgi:hypothetical protein
VVKPTIRRGFNYKALHWADLPHAPDGDAQTSLAPRSADEDASAVAA